MPTIGIAQRSNPPIDNAATIVRDAAAALFSPQLRFLHPDQINSCLSVVKKILLLGKGEKITLLADTVASAALSNPEDWDRPLQTLQIATQEMQRLQSLWTTEPQNTNSRAFRSRAEGSPAALRAYLRIALGNAANQSALVPFRGEALPTELERIVRAAVDLRHRQPRLDQQAWSSYLSALREEPITAKLVGFIWRMANFAPPDTQPEEIWISHAIKFEKEVITKLLQDDTQLLPLRAALESELLDLYHALEKKQVKPGKRADLIVQFTDHVQRHKSAESSPFPPIPNGHESEVYSFCVSELKNTQAPRMVLPLLRTALGALSLSADEFKTAEQAQKSLNHLLDCTLALSLAGGRRVFSRNTFPEIAQLLASAPLVDASNLAHAISRQLKSAFADDRTQREDQIWFRSKYIEILASLTATSHAAEGKAAASATIIEAWNIDSRPTILDAASAGVLKLNDTSAIDVATALGAAQALIHDYCTSRRDNKLQFSKIFGPTEGKAYPVGARAEPVSVIQAALSLIDSNRETHAAWASAVTKIISDYRDGLSPLQLLRIIRLNKIIAVLGTL